MMDEGLQELWSHLNDTYRSYIQLRMSLMKNPAAIPIIRAALHKPHERGLALEIISLYPDSERTVFFDELLLLGSHVNGFTVKCHVLILTMPRDWVLTNIERAMATILDNGDYEEYRCLLGLCSKLDDTLVTKFANQALLSDDEDIREAGADFLSQ